MGCPYRASVVRMGVELASLTTLPRSGGQKENPEIFHLSPLFLLILSASSSRISSSSSLVTASILWIGQLVYILW